MHKAKSFKAANEFDIQYYLSMSSRERLETMQLLRETFLKMTPGARNAKGRKGLRRVITIVQ